MTDETRPDQDDVDPQAPAEGEISDPPKPTAQTGIELIGVDDDIEDAEFVEAGDEEDDTSSLDDDVELEDDTPTARAPEDADETDDDTAEADDAESDDADADDEEDEGEDAEEAPELVEPAPPEQAPDATARLEAALSSLADVSRSAGMRTLAAEVTGERLPALREGKVTVVVLGEFNHGKSTILNALLGGEVLPMGITPTTAVITHLRYSEEPTATVYYDENDYERVPLERLPELVAQDQKVEPKYVEVGYPAELLKDNLVLVDTPGVNDISRQRVEITYGYLPRADVILYVLDANQVLKKSEITFIKDRLLRGSLDRLLFVLGKVDTLSPEDREEVETYAREKLAELIGPVELYPVSAREAMRGGDAGFTLFKDNLTSYLRERKSFILVDSGVSGGLRVAGMLQQNLAIKRGGYALDRAELERRVEAVRRRIGDARRVISENIALIDETTIGMKATARHNLSEFTDKFAAALPRELERSSPADIQKHLPDWIRDTYKEWLEEEGRSIARELERLAQKIIETTNRNLGDAVMAVQDELGLEAGTLNLEFDTTPYDFGVLALGAAGISVAVFGSVIAGGLLILAAPVLAFVIKGKAESHIREMAKENGERAIRDAGARVEEEMTRVIEEYGDQLRNFVETAGDRLYKQVNEALEQVMRDTEDVTTDKKALDGVAEAAEAEVAVIIEELVAIRADLLTL